MLSTNAFQANVFDECYREASSSSAGHRLRRHHNVLCHPAPLVIGNAVITTCCVIQLRWSSASPSSQRVVSSSSAVHRLRRHHNVLCHPAPLVIGYAVICDAVYICVESLTPFQQPSPGIPTKAGLSWGRFQQIE